MKFYSSNTASLMAQLREHAKGDMSVVEAAMAMALKKQRAAGKRYVTLEQVKSSIDEINFQNSL